MDKEQIKIQIEDLKANLEALERELNKPNKFEFKYDKDNTYYISSYKIIAGYDGEDKDYLPKFRFRQKETNAEADFKLQKGLMCIGALAEQIDQDYKNRVIWDEKNENYYIYYDNKYKIFYHTSMKALGVIYMPKDVAEKVSEILNNKEVEL